MELQEQWAEICFLLSDNIKSDINEKDFEGQIVRVMEKLGWIEYKGEIKSQPVIPIGRGNSIRPDIVIFGPDKIAKVVIEIKRPTEDLLKSEATGQLKSYMRQVKSEFGLLVGNRIRMYYDGDKISQPEPLMLVEIPFNKSDKKGLNFAAMFEREKFLNGKYEPYLNDLIQQFKAKRSIYKLKGELSDESTKNKIIDFLKDVFSDYGSGIVEDAFRNLQIELLFNGGQPPKPQPKPLPPVGPDPIEPMKETLYKIILGYPNGINALDLEKISGFSTKQVANHVFKLKKLGKIQNLKKGVYAALTGKKDLPKMAKKKKKPVSVPNSSNGMRAKIYKMIKKRKKGLSAEKLYERTEYSRKQIANAVFSLKSKGYIDTVSKGVYIAVK